MEERELNVNYNKSGRGSYTPRLTLPIRDLRKMKVSPEDRKIKYYYNEENEIMILSKKDLTNYEIKLIKKNK